MGLLTIIFQKAHVCAQGSACCMSVPCVSAACVPAGLYLQLTPFVLLHTLSYLAHGSHIKRVTFIVKAL